MRNPYDVLGVSREADPVVIAAAYRALMRKHHPDDQGDEGRAKEINEAYCILTDPELLRSYEASVDQEHSETPTSQIWARSTARGGSNTWLRPMLIGALAAGAGYLIWQEAVQPQASTRAAEVQAAAPLAQAAAQATAAPPPLQSPPVSLTTFPERFRGEWNQRLEDCGTAMNDSRLVITATMIAFYESRGGIHVLQQTSPREISGYVSLTGEGEGPWLSWIGFKLSEDGSSLADEGGTVRQRCPSAA